MKIRMRPVLPILCLALAGCAGRHGMEPSRYDLAAARVPAGSSVVAVVEVAAPSWLESVGIQYRLAYADAARRASYSQSRWVAPPAEMLGQMLRRGLLGTGPCRLQVEVDEFLQVFDAPASSRGVVEARASLYAGPGRALLARQAFRVSRPAPTADAEGGIAALGSASGDLLQSLRAWLEGQPACQAR